MGAGNIACLLSAALYSYGLKAKWDNFLSLLPRRKYYILSSFSKLVIKPLFLLLEDQRGKESS